MFTIASFSLLVSCSKSESSPDPGEGLPKTASADFTFSGAGIAPSTVTFTNTSANAKTYSWDFGDSSTSTTASPTHTYSKEGTFTVKLVASGVENSNSITKTVTIGKPTAVKIMALNVLEMPLLAPSGDTWDTFDPAFAGADVFYRIFDARDTLLVRGPKYYQDVTASMLPLSFTLPTPIQITDFTSVHEVILFDYDPDSPDDEIGSAKINLSVAARLGYPSTYDVGTNGFKIRLTLQWQ